MIKEERAKLVAQLNVCLEMLPLIRRRKYRKRLLGLIAALESRLAE
jgi:hypothetical protein